MHFDRIPMGWIKSIEMWYFYLPTSLSTTTPPKLILIAVTFQTRPLRHHTVLCCLWRHLKWENVFSFHSKAMMEKSAKDSGTPAWVCELHFSYQFFLSILLTYFSHIMYRKICHKLCILLYVHLFIIHSVYWMSCYFYADHSLLKLPAPH